MYLARQAYVGEKKKATWKVSCCFHGASCKWQLWRPPAENSAGKAGTGYAWEGQNAKIEVIVQVLQTLTC